MTTSTGDKPNIFPALRYKAGSAALDWFKALGFEELMVVRAPDGRVNHAELRLGPGVVMLGEIGVAEGHEAVDAAGFSVAVYVAEVDAHYERAMAAGAQIEQEPYDTDYGARMFSVRDPAGNLWTFGNYRPQT